MVGVASTDAADKSVSCSETEVIRLATGCTGIKGEPAADDSAFCSDEAVPRGGGSTD